MQATDRTATAALIAAIVIHTFGPAGLVMQSAVVQGLVEYAGFSEEQAGFVAAAENLGTAITAIGMAFLARYVNWRATIGFALIAFIVGNLVSGTVTDLDAMRAARFMVGIGAGIIISLTYATIGLSARPERSFGFAFTTLLLYIAIGLAAAPLLLQTFGVRGLFWGFAATGMLSLAFIPALPRSGEERLEVGAEAVDLPWRHNVWALAAMLVYFIALSALLTYLFRLAQAKGLTEQGVANALAVSQIAGIAGAVALAALGRRVGRTRGVVGTVLACALFTGLLVEPMTAVWFSLLACAFAFFQNLSHPYLLSSLAQFERRGRMVIYGTSMQFIGFAIGPAVAAFLVGTGGYESIVALAAGLFALSAALIGIPLVAHRREVAARSP